MVIPITDEREKERFNEIIDTGSEFRILNEYAENVLNIGKYEYSYNSIEKKLSVSMPLSLENIEYVIKKYLQRENSVNINKKNECHEIVFEDKLYEYDVMLEGKCYGIDLGTTYSCISKYENGEVKIIADEEGGSDLLASAVFVKDDGNELIIGEGAKEEGVLAPERLFQFFKRWIGKDPETEPDYKHYIVDGKEYTPVELSSLVLKRIKEYAKKAGEEVEDVIITCPAYFDFAQRELTKKAGELAGLNVLAVINEPMAVAISYSNEEYLKSQNVLVYDLGGGTFDVTLLKIDIDSNEKKIDVIATDGDAFLGGADWDNEMHKLLIEKYREQFGVAEEDIDEELKEMLRSVTEKLKQKLTMQTTVTYKTKYDGERIQLEISREEFDERTKDLLVKTEWLLNSILSSIGLGNLAHNWLGERQTALYAIMFVIIWKEFGYGVMLILARLLSVDESLIEAARLDGASYFTIARKILIPDARAVISFFFVLSMINMLSWLFNYVYVLTKGGPINSTYVLDFYIYQLGAKFMNYGAASALAVMLLVITMLFVSIQAVGRRMLSSEDA